MKFPLRVPEERIVDRPWKFVRQGRSYEHSSLVSPAPSDIFDSVTTTANDKEGDTKFAHEVDTFAMSGNREVKRPESVAAQRVRSALQDNRRWTESGDGILNDCFKDREIHFVIDPISQRDVERKVFSEAKAVVVKFSSPGEEVAGVFVERDGHDPVGGVECLFDAISVVNIDVNIKDPGMVPGHMTLVLTVGGNFSQDALQ